MNIEEWNAKVIKVLKGYESLEAEIISANELWWPYRENDALRGSIYEKFLELQEMRHEILEAVINKQYEYAGLF